MKITNVILIFILVLVAFGGCVQSAAGNSNSESFVLTDSENSSADSLYEISKSIEINLDNWLGEYEYVHNPGIAVRGYSLLIYKEQDKYYGHLLVGGRMLDFRARTYIQGTATSISVIFDTYLNSEDNFVSDDYVPESLLMTEWGELKKGDILFHLEGHEEEGRPVATHWRCMPLPDCNAFEKKTA